MNLLSRRVGQSSSWSPHYRRAIRIQTLKERDDLSPCVRIQLAGGLSQEGATMVGQRARNRHCCCSPPDISRAVTLAFAGPTYAKQLRGPRRLSSRGTFASAIRSARSRARKESHQVETLKDDPMLCSLNDVASQSLMFIDTLCADLDRTRCRLIDHPEEVSRVIFHNPTARRSRRSPSSTSRVTPGERAHVRRSYRAHSRGEHRASETSVMLSPRVAMESAIGSEDARHAG